jgi:FkbM family methyltransferase
MVSNGWEIIELNKLNIRIKSKNIEIELRLQNSSDVAVFKQVFINEEYKPLIDIVSNNKLKTENIIDAGSNIGLFSLYIYYKLGDLNIIQIEPVTNNAILLEKNLKVNKIIPNIYKYGLYSEDDMNLYIDNSFRDGKDWAKSTTISTENTELKSITINTLLHKSKIDILDILKIDIEGAERFVFESENHASFLLKVKILALEIHDEFDIRDKIYQILINYNFFILNIGETTFAINKNLV